jgi:hypothetical protein
LLLLELSLQQCALLLSATTKHKCR